MSGKTFSNADTGNKPADPYKAKNKDEAPLKEKIEDLISFVEASKFGMMTTKAADSGLLEDGGIAFIFHTNTESGKTDDLATDPKINIAFINSSGEWASISGEAEVITDRDLVKKHYSRQLKAWLGDLGDGKHDGGPDDPRIGVIKVNTITATYAVANRNAVARGVEIAKGAVTGEAASVNKLRSLTAEEINTWRTSVNLVK